MRSKKGYNYLKKLANQLKIIRKKKKSRLDFDEMTNLIKLHEKNEDIKTYSLIKTQSINCNINTNIMSEDTLMENYSEYLMKNAKTSVEEDEKYLINEYNCKNKKDNILNSNRELSYQILDKVHHKEDLMITLDTIKGDQDSQCEIKRSNSAKKSNKSHNKNDEIFGEEKPKVPIIKLTECEKQMYAQSTFHKCDRDENFNYGNYLHINSIQQISNYRNIDNKEKCSNSINTSSNSILSLSANNNNKMINFTNSENSQSIQKLEKNSNNEITNNLILIKATESFKNYSFNLELNPTEFDKQKSNVSIPYVDIFTSKTKKNQESEENLFKFQKSHADEEKSSNRNNNKDNILEEDERYVFKSILNPNPKKSCSQKRKQNSGSSQHNNFINSNMKRETLSTKEIKREKFEIIKLHNNDFEEIEDFPFSERKATKKLNLDSSGYFDSSLIDKVSQDESENSYIYSSYISNDLSSDDVSEDINSNEDNDGKKVRKSKAHKNKDKQKKEKERHYNIYNLNNIQSTDTSSFIQLKKVQTKENSNSQEKNFHINYDCENINNQEYKNIESNSCKRMNEIVSQKNIGHNTNKNYDLEILKLKKCITIQGLKDYNSNADCRDIENNLDDEKLNSKPMNKTKRLKRNSFVENNYISIINKKLKNSINNFNFKDIEWEMIMDDDALIYRIPNHKNFRYRNSLYEKDYNFFSSKLSKCSDIQQSDYRMNYPGMPRSQKKVISNRFIIKDELENVQNFKENLENNFNHFTLDKDFNNDLLVDQKNINDQQIYEKNLKSIRRNTMNILANEINKNESNKRTNNQDHIDQKENKLLNIPYYPINKKKDFKIKLFECNPNKKQHV